MFSLLLMTACVKSPTNNQDYVWPVGVELDYNVVVSQTGLFGPSGGLDVGSTTYTEFTLSCVAEVKSGRYQPMNCSIPSNVVYRISRRDGSLQDFPDQTYDGEIKLKWQSRYLKKFDADGILDLFRASVQNAAGALSTAELPDVCELGKKWTDKKEHMITRLEYLNGPGSRKAEHELTECGEQTKLYTVTTNRISSQVALGADGVVSQEAPRFDLTGYSLSTFDSQGLLISKEFQQKLTATSLGLAPGSISHTVVVSLVD